MPTAPFVPPEWARALIPGGWDANKWTWDPYTQTVRDRYTGGSYNLSGSDPNMGSQLVTDLSAYNSSGGQQGVVDLGGATPYFGFGDSAQGYDAGLMPNSGIFASLDPNEIADYRSHRDDVVNRGIATVGTVVGGGAALGSLLGGGAGAAGAGGAGGATTFPYAATGGSISVSPLAGASAGVGAAGAAGGSAMLDSSGAVIPGMGGGGGGGGLLGNLSGLLGGASNWGPLIGGLLGAIDANNQPNSMQTNTGGTSSSTYGSTLPAEITGPAGQALQALLAQYGQGYNVAGVDPNTTAAMSQLQNLGSNQFATGADINPYLDNVFNTAADSTQNRLASEFAHAGRLNTGSHQQARSQDLQTLAANVYAPGFEAERQRQYGAIESNLGRQLSSVYPMLAGGEYLRDVNQQQNNAGMMNIQQLMAGLQGLAPFYPGTQTQNTNQTGSIAQPLFNNPMAGFLGGAQLGSLITGG